MSKSARKKKASRQRRDDAAAVEQRRREKVAVAQEANRRVQLLLDPESAPADVADAVVFLYGVHRMPTRDLTRTLLAGGGVDRLVDIAAAVDERAPASLLSLGFAAEIGAARADVASVSASLTNAVATASTTAGGAAAVSQLCLEFDEVVLAEGALLPWIGALRGEHVGREHVGEDYVGESHVGEDDAEELRDAYSALIRAVERTGGRPDLVAAFGDRSRMDEVRHVVGRWTAANPTWARALDEHLPRGTVDEAALVDVGLSPEVPILLIEHAWLTADPTPDALAAPPTQFLTLLERAADAAADDGVAQLMRDWPSTVQYGLWQVVDPTPDPGVYVMDITTGVRYYVAMAPEQIADLPRWSVLLGALVADGPVWRTTAAVVRLSPDEGDALIPLIDEAFAMVARAFDKGGRTTSSPPLGAFPLPGQADPAGVLARVEASAPPEISFLMSRVIGSLLDRIAHTVLGWRQQRPRLVNMDGHPIVQLSVRIQVASVDAVVRALAGHPDFSPGEDRGEWTWWARELTRAEREQSRAEVLRAQPEAEFIDDGASQRWVRGLLVVRRDELRVDLNSQERLDMLLEILTSAGAEPIVLERTSVDPHQDMVLPSVFDVGQQQSPESHAVWVRTWVDDTVPALGGMTPREAAADEQMSMYLEALLRMFEWRADRAAADSGSAPADFDSLRETLDMPPFQFL